MGFDHSAFACLTVVADFMPVAFALFTDLE